MSNIWLLFIEDLIVAVGEWWSHQRKREQWSEIIGNKRNSEEAHGTVGGSHLGLPVLVHIYQKNKKLKDNNLHLSPSIRSWKIRYFMLLRLMAVTVTTHQPWASPLCLRPSLFHLLGPLYHYCLLLRSHHYCLSILQSTTVSFSFKEQMWNAM